MSGLKIEIDVQKIASQMKEFALEVEQDIEKGVGALAQAAQIHIKEMANQELKSSRDKFMKALPPIEEVARGVWVITINESGLWVEDGIPQNTDMKPKLLNGKSSVVVPFDHTVGPSRMTPTGQNILMQLKKELRSVGLGIGKIEKDASGSPRVGPKVNGQWQPLKLHNLNFNSPIPGKGNTPALHGVSIYQTMTDSGKARRDVVTFRTVKADQAGKWIHPGLTAKHFIERTYDWALEEWKNKILPEVIKRWSG